VKLTKILGLAAVAAVASMAFASNASAVRVHPLIKYCLKQELLLCEDKWTIEPASGKLKGLQIGTGTLEGTINQKCTGGTIEGTSAATSVEGPGAEESRLLGETTSLTFTGCEPCKKITATNLPFTTNLRHTSETEKAANELWLLEGKGGAKFEECSFGISCKFGATELKPAPFLENTATGAVVNTNKAELKREEGSEFFCGNVGKWNAKYQLELELKSDKVIHKEIWATLCKKEAPANICR
jgi:hypothetical protein